MKRREFLKKSGQAALVVSSLSIISTITNSCSSDDNNPFDDGYYGNGYYGNGYYGNGYGG